VQEAVQEPLLKYERVGGHFHAIFKDDSLSCIALHVNFVCAGTYGGNVLLLELDGRFIRRLHQHYKKVNQVCIDETGQVRCSWRVDCLVYFTGFSRFPPVHRILLGRRHGGSVYAVSDGCWGFGDE
jgi:hypothetical protein